jgi:hypothetical protein
MRPCSYHGKKGVIRAIKGHQSLVMLPLVAPSYACGPKACSVVVSTVKKVPLWAAKVAT